jgi:hypothetical protein
MLSSLRQAPRVNQDLPCIVWYFDAINQRATVPIETQHRMPLNSRTQTTNLGTHPMISPLLPLNPELHRALVVLNGNEPRADTMKDGRCIADPY